MKLPSGAELEITLSPFPVSKALYQTILEETKGIELSSKMEMFTVFRELFLTSMCSPRIEKCLWECMKRVTYNGLRITEDTFEPEEAREDYPIVCLEVAHKNVAPFLKNLSAQYSTLLEKLGGIQG